VRRNLQRPPEAIPGHQREHVLTVKRGEVTLAPRALLLLTGAIAGADAIRVSALRARIAALDAKIAEIRTLAAVPIVQTEIDKLKRERRELVAAESDVISGHSLGRELLHADASGNAVHLQHER
jgi:hypothetical protein